MNSVTEMQLTSEQLNCNGTLNFKEILTNETILEYVKGYLELY